MQDPHSDTVHASGDSRRTGGVEKPPASTQPETPAIGRGGLYLIVMHHDGMRAQRLRSDRAVTVGRAPECDVPIDTPLLSRVHFSLTVSLTGGSPVVLRDLRSANGTKVNGKAVAPDAPAQVELGALLEAGGAFFTVRDHVPADAVVASEASLRAASRTGGPPAPSGVIIADTSMQRLHELVELVARSSIAVLVTGETGSGKEIISAAVHERSARSNKPFVSLNCAALPETLLESELFGYERGAFTGAVQAKPGLIESADEGTLFLDEIGEMPLPTQAKLLRVLENGEITRIGAVKRRVVDVRFIAATNRDLPALVGRGEFRRDLYFRLNGITIPVPPLRERPAEIEPLAAHFLQLGARRAHRRAPTLAPDVLPALLAHSWPGNIRELRNVMDRALALCTGSVVHAEHIVLDQPVPDASQGAVRTPPTSMAPVGAVPTSSAPPASGDKVGRLLRVDPETERQMIVDALKRAGGHQGRAAELLGVSRRTLINRLDEYAIERPRKRGES